MATSASIDTSNTFESTVAGRTVRARAHSLSAWFVLSLRLMMGAAFLWAGWTKLPFVAGEAFDATGYLRFATVANGSPLADAFVAMSNVPWLMTVANVAVPWGELLLGLGLLVGAFTRLASFFGALLMATFYLGNWSVEHGVINGDFAYMLVFLAVAAFGAGRILGLDAYIENYEVGGVPLLERYPVLEYVLG
ncbi:DoxX family membrane protein [Halorarum halophilum]|uniref:DoxX family membrane protein n=1 Tax=Halorarum halophilum TaxID=2743090 RepID=A0A7D5KDF5_9EURY|nr:MauE/DoxX family redox-associated membrane protein [Halobaculum halophilum]QLG26116.1 DoxX family membrane protein [Halobaculum halophilum]